LIARSVIILAALAVAIASALVFLPIAALLDPVTRAAGVVFSASSIIAVIDAFFTPPAEGPDTALLFALWILAVTICVAPIFIVSLIGEATGTASPLFYVAATGVIAAGLPWLLRARYLGKASESVAGGEVELRLALLFFVTGACSGFVYWLIAGHGAGRASPQS
jgi:hypothetical protein